MLVLKGLMVAATVVSLIVGAIEEGAMSMPSDSGAAVHVHGGPNRATGELRIVRSALAGARVARPRVDGVCSTIVGDGVRIRSAGDKSGAVLGLAYYPDVFKVVQVPPGDYAEGTDLRTGVHGWVALEFVNFTYPPSC
ncbi:hypothetical protein [Kutzneria sp. 744]|uniref:hypothetical protein n=1 Tax=Kutzneria sp. (strain 744) TaxID=345341 RepID=UPI0003EEC199|nr:hypothetical protein [Kutzneria sp. 744]EWM15269.1 hypothetical protein KUTG_05573 [Kutzneria sp. 744]